MTGEKRKLLKDSFIAFKEIFLTTTNMVFWVVDLIAFFISLQVKAVSFSPLFYLIVLVLGFLLSSIKIISDKNIIIEAHEKEVPIVGVYLRRIPKEGGFRMKVQWPVLRIRNLHDKPIKDINFRPINAYLFKYIFKIEGTNILKPDEERNIISTDEYKGLPILSNFDPKYATANFEMIFTFEDSNNNKYKTYYNLGKSGIFMKSTEKV